MIFLVGGDKVRILGVIAPVGKNRAESQVLTLTRWALSVSVNGKGGFPCFPLKCPVGKEWNRAGEYGRGVAKEQIKGYREVRLAGWIVERGGAHEPHPS